MNAIDALNKLAQETRSLRARLDLVEQRAGKTVPVEQTATRQSKYQPQIQKILLTEAFATGVAFGLGFWVAALPFVLFFRLELFWSG